MDKTTSELDALRKLRADIEAALSRLNAALDAAAAAGSAEAVPTEVLIRWTTGPEVKIFHSVDAPCKRVRSLESFTRIRYKTAIDRGLRKCSACNWSKVHHDDA